MTCSASVGRWYRFVAVLVVAGTWVATPTVAAAQVAEGSFERTLKVAGPVELHIQSGPGGIHVRAGAVGSSVTVMGRIRPENAWFAADVDVRIKQIEKTPPIEQDGNVIHVGRFSDPNLPKNISITYDVTVPPQSSVTARNGSGAIQIFDLAGPVDASTGSGGITIERIAGPVSANSGSGRLEVSGAGSLRAKTGSGGLHAMSVAGDVTATSGSGSIQIDIVGKGSVDVSSSSGAVKVSGVNGAATVSTSSSGLEIEGRPAGPWNIRSSSGQVTLHVPPDASFDVDAHVSSGKIETTHPITVKGTVDKRWLQGQVRGGGPLVSVRTSSGGIRIQ
jgi:DUF4097 and DUF4098 domain-containing protein YvlB